MTYITTQDFFSIRKASIINDDDLILLAHLYQPIIGYQGLALYLTLLAFHNFLFNETIIDHNRLLDHMQITINDLSLAKSQLEGVGLLRSFYKKKKDVSEWIYVLYAPKSPKQFFDDVVFSGMLTNAVSEEIAQKWQLFYQENLSISGYQEKSATFGEVYHPDFTSSAFARIKSANCGFFGKTGPCRYVEIEFL